MQFKFTKTSTCPVKQTMTKRNKGLKKQKPDKLGINYVFPVFQLKFFASSSNSKHN